MVKWYTTLKNAKIDQTDTQTHTHFEQIVVGPFSDMRMQRPTKRRLTLKASRSIAVVSMQLNSIQCIQPLGSTYTLWRTHFRNSHNKSSPHTPTGRQKRQISERSNSTWKLDLDQSLRRFWCVCMSSWRRTIG